MYFGACTYSGHSQKHYYQLLLVEHRMSDERICKPGQTFPSLLEEASIGSYRIAID
jgi:hypothetical protein